MKHIEKQIFDKYGNYDFPTDIKQDGLNTATTQIEEMCNYLKECSNNAWAKGFDYAEIDNEKLRAFLDLFPKDSVVVNKAEFERLNKVETELQELNAEYYNEVKRLQEVAKQFRVEIKEDKEC